MIYLSLFWRRANIIGVLCGLAAGDCIYLLFHIFFFLKRLFLDVKGGCIAWLMLVLCGDEKLVFCAGD